MTEERITKEDILTTQYRNLSETQETLAARITALGLLAIAQAIDGITKQIKRVIDTEMPPEQSEQPELVVVPDGE